VKICSRCKRELELEKFIKNKNCKDGRAGICKDCSNKYSAEWKRKNKDKISKQNKQIYLEKVKLRQEKTREQNKKNNPLLMRARQLYAGMRDRSKEKGYGFDSKILTINYLVERLKNQPFCECCGKEFDVSYERDVTRKNEAPSIDRVDSKRGYTVDNVAIICWECNKHKQDATSDQLRMLADWIDKWNSERINQTNYKITQIAY
jgi:hypothetical protein